MRPWRIVYAVTVPITAAAFLVHHLRELRRAGHEVHLVSDPRPTGVVEAVTRASGASFHGVPMARELAPRRDPASLWGLYRTLRALRPDILNVGTPKAGLLGGLAGVLAGVPVRVYTLHGLRSETARHGPLRRWRRLLLATEWLACTCAHAVVCVSASNRDEALRLGLLNPRKARVLGAGSASGVDVARWARVDPAAVRAVRDRLGLSEGTPVVGFLGRLVPQKGLADLLAAWALVQAARPDARLLLVGEPEAANPLPAPTTAALAAGRGLVRTPFLDDPAPLYPLLSVLTLPSLHEGLGMVLLEAAAAGVPTVVTDAPGVRDAVRPGVSGLMVPPADPPALAGALLELLNDPGRARQLGQAGHAWVAAEFAQERRDQDWQALYAELFAAAQARGDRLKRVFDVAVSALALLLLGAPLLLVALAVRVFLGSPVLFMQRRPGLGGRPFALMKFRSMTDARGPDGGLLPDARRLTAFGRWLRSSSLDELPELINILRGDMSLVGPRPLLMEYLPLYSPEQARRHDVRPGLTGLAQVSGRNALSWEDKFRLDLQYIDTRSLTLDLAILLRTVLKVLRRQDINFAGGGTERPFTGTPTHPSTPQETP